MVGVVNPVTAYVVEKPGTVCSGVVIPAAFDGVTEILLVLGGLIVQGSDQTGGGVEVGRQVEHAGHVGFPDSMCKERYILQVLSGK